MGEFEDQPEVCDAAILEDYDSRCVCGRDWWRVSLVVGAPSEDERAKAG
jgi:hypothetical protein